MYNNYYGSSYYSTPPTTTTTSGEAGAIIATILGLGIVFWLIVIALSILILVARWKVFKKAGVGGWESLIPVHSDIVELQLGGVQTYWWFLNLIVLCGIGPIILAFWKNIALSKAFGKGTGFGVLLTFFPYVCYPILGFGKAEYVGPEKKETNA